MAPIELTHRWTGQCSNRGVGHPIAVADGSGTYEYHEDRYHLYVERTAAGLDRNILGHACTACTSTPTWVLARGI
jgi:hypothetical protein